MTTNSNLGKKIIIVEDEEPLRILYEKATQTQRVYRMQPSKG